MEELNVAGKRYISSKRAEKLTGYTHDYLGQLCREDKLNCKRVGRAWYISEDSVCTYKKQHRREHEEYVKEKRSSQPRSIFGAFSYSSEKGSLQPNITKENKDSSDDAKEDEQESEEKEAESKSEEMDVKKTVSKTSAKRSPHVADVREIQKTKHKNDGGHRIESSVPQQEKGFEKGDTQQATPTKKKQSARTKAPLIKDAPITALFALVIVALFSVGTLMFERVVEYDRAQQASAQGFQFQAANAIEIFSK